MFPGMFKQLRLFAPDPYDYILSKLERNTSKDRDDAIRFPVVSTESLCGRMRRGYLSERLVLLLGRE